MAGAAVVVEPECCVVVQNTFVNVVETTLLAKSSSLRPSMSDSMLCRQGMEEATFSPYGDKFERLAEVEVEGTSSESVARSLSQHSRKNSEGSLSSTAGPDGSAESSCAEEKRLLVEKSDFTDPCRSKTFDEYDGSSQTTHMLKCMQSDSISAAEADNSRLTSENTALKENWRLLQMQTAERWDTQMTVLSPCEYNSYNTIWVPVEFQQCQSMVAFNQWTADEAPVQQKRQPLRNRKGDCHSTKSQGGTSKEVRRGATVAEDSARGDTRTTVMLRNLPNNYTRAMLVKFLSDEGFGDRYDFLYLPIDFRTRAALGYAFVNLVGPDVVQHFWKAFEGFSKWALPSKKRCFVTWCEPHQGLHAHIDRYRNSPVMHTSVPDEYQPILLEKGVRTPFPSPTKMIRAPRVRDCRPDCR